MINLPLAGLRPCFALILSITLFLGCRKDFNITENQTSAVEQSTSTIPVTIAEAKKWFEQSVKNRSIESPVLPDDVYPLWYMAEESRFQGSGDIVIVPIVPKDSLIDIESSDRICLVVFKNTDNEIDGCFTVFVSDGSASTGELSTSNFRGALLTVSLIGRPLTIVQILNDTLIGGSNNSDSIFYRIVADPNMWETDPGDGCFDFSSGKFWKTVGGWFSTIGGWLGSGSGGGTIIIFPGGFGGPINIDYPGTEIPPTGGGGNTLSQYFQNAIFGNATIFSQPAQYPCRNQWLPGIDEPAGQSAAMPALLTAHAAGIGNFAMQWILLMATGNYDVPEDALVDIDWDEVGNSNTNDMMDGTTMNTALLQNVITMLNQAKAQGCGYTVQEAWDALQSGPPILEGVVYLDADSNSDNELNPNSILPYSCETFDFINVGITSGQMHAIVSDLEISFVELYPFQAYKFKLNFEVVLDDLGSQTCTAQNVAATALNLAVSELTAAMGLSRSYKTATQTQVEAWFEEIFDENMHIYLSQSAVNEVHCPPINSGLASKPKYYFPGFPPDCCD